jgi:hypothetical protein
MLLLSIVQSLSTSTQALRLRYNSKLRWNTILPVPDKWDATLILLYSQCWGPSGTGSVRQMCGLGSFYQQEKIVRKTLISIVL